MQRALPYITFVIGAVVILLGVVAHHFMMQPTVSPQAYEPPSQLEQDVTYAMNHQVSNPRTVVLPFQQLFSVMNWETRDRYTWTDPELNRQLWTEIPQNAVLTEMNSIPDGRVLSCYSPMADMPAPRCTNGLAVLAPSELYDTQNK